MRLLPSIFVRNSSVRHPTLRSVVVAAMSEGRRDETLNVEPEPANNVQTLTDHLNKRLLQSFLQRLNETCEAPTVPQVDSTAPDDFNDS